MTKSTVVLLWVATILAVGVAASAGRHSQRVHMETHLPSVEDLARTADWRMGDRAAADAEIKLYIAVKQQNLNQLEETLMAVSDPKSPRYGAHLSMEEVNALVAPSAESVHAIREWLEDAGAEVSFSSSNDDFIIARTTVGAAERLLGTEYHLFTAGSLHSSTRRSHPLMRAARPYSLPASIASHVDFVAPTVHFPAPSQSALRHERERARAHAHASGSGVQLQNKHHKSHVEAPRDDGTTPSLLRELYQIGNITGSSKNNSVAVASFLEQYWSPSDLKTFIKNYCPLITQTVTQVGYNDASDPGDEAELDVQYVSAMAAGVPTWVYYTEGRAPNPDNEPFLDWLVNVSATATVPWVFSVSYGEDEKSVGLDYASRVNVEFQKLGTRGVTILFASGDDGTGGNCTTSRFTPNFPCGSPYVTAVGGTENGTPGKVPTGEDVVYFSGGGFSDYWARPSYQDSAVAAYLKQSNLPPNKNYNQTGRGYPDVSALAVDFIIVMDGFAEAVDGTSCSTPTFGGIVALLNGIRLSKGKSPLGFLNPLLYSTVGPYADAFNDIVSGANEGCDGEDAFPATKGWDASTGWGTPNYAVLSKLVDNLP